MYLTGGSYSPNLTLLFLSAYRRSADLDTVNTIKEADKTWQLILVG